MQVEPTASVADNSVAPAQKPPMPTPPELLLLKLKDFDRRRAVQKERAAREQEMHNWQSLVTMLRSIDEKTAQAKLETVLTTLSRMSQLSLTADDYKDANSLSQYTLRALATYCNRHEREHMESAFFRSEAFPTHGISAAQSWELRNAQAALERVAEAFKLT